MPLKPSAIARARRTPRGVVGAEHEVVDEELRAPSEKVLERGASLVGVEPVLLVDPDPRQRLPPLRELVAAPRQLLLRLEQLEPRGEPLVAGPGRVRRSVASSSFVSPCKCVCRRVVGGAEIDLAPAPAG